jgi:hypothetical protein
MPKQTRVSLSDGLYSTNSPSGVGINPGMTSPMPFSIQMPTMQSTHVTFSHLRLRLTGSTSNTMATRLKPMAVQIQGTSAWWPCRPRNRYLEEATCRLPE